MTRDEALKTINDLSKRDLAKALKLLIKEYDSVRMESFTNYWQARGAEWEAAYLRGKLNALTPLKEFPKPAITTDLEQIIRDQTIKYLRPEQPVKVTPPPPTRLARFTSWVKSIYALL